MPSRAWHDENEASDADIAALCRTGIPGYDPWRDTGGATFDAGAARKAFKFFHGHLRLIEGETAGQPFALEDWQAAIVGNLFGWKREDGTRRYREAFVLVPRKNGKTPLCAGIALYLLVRDDEPGAQVYSAAAELTQSALLYRHALGMRDADPRLRAAIVPRRSGKALEVPSTSSYFRALSADAETKHGFNVHGAIVDELHVHPNANLVRVLTSATSSRRQPLVVYITTADYERVSACNDLHDYSRKVRDGVFSAPRFLPVLYEASPHDDWTDPEVWKRANPNLGVSKKMEYLVENCQKAKDIPSYRNEFLRLDLNVRTSVHEVLVDMDQWGACAGVPAAAIGTDAHRPAYEAFAESLVGLPCFGGLDLATTNDLIAFALYFPTVASTLLWFWSPRETALVREKRDRVPYVDWARDGWLALTNGNVADYDRVEADVLAQCRRFRPTVVNFDTWNATQMAQRLIAGGVTMAPMVQGFRSLSPPTKELVERLLPSRTLRHGGHPVLSWMATHVQGERDAAGNVKPSKAISRERIDGIVALVMAIGASQVAPVAVPPVKPAVAFTSFADLRGGGGDDDSTD